METDKKKPLPNGSADTASPVWPSATADQPKKNPLERNGPKGPEPTRYGDWEQKGRCTDF